MFFIIVLAIFHYLFNFLYYVGVGMRALSFYIFNKSEKATEAAFSERERNTLLFQRCGS